MKKTVGITLLLLVLGIVVVFLGVQSVHNDHQETPQEMKSAIEGPSVQPNRPAQAPPADRPSRPVQTTPAQPIRPAQAPQQEEQLELVQVPFRVAFIAEAPPEFNKPVPVNLVIRTNPPAWPAAAAGDLQVEFLLRLPAGVRLDSPDWAPVELPPEEQDESEGVWSLFERKLTVQVNPAAVPPELVREPISLAVVETGTNWIITTRARVVKGEEVWQSFGVIFATLEEGGVAAFSPAPRKPDEGIPVQPTR